mgnify:CR=1 FL=1
MILMQTHINRLKQEIDRLEWEGEFRKADLVKESLRIAECKLMRGELFEPDF